MFCFNTFVFSTFWTLLAEAMVKRRVARRVARSRNNVVLSFWPAKTETKIETRFSNVTFHTKLGLVARGPDDHKLFHGSHEECFLSFNKVSSRSSHDDKELRYLS